jgi:hypothetical protein
VLEQVTITASDHAAARTFYDTVLAVLGIAAADADDGVARWGDFAVAQADDEHPVTRGLHVGFTAPTRADVDAFWRTGVDAGYRDDGPPGVRPEYGDDYYGGFLLDPDGNSAEGVHHDNLRPGGPIDHVWMRVSDLAAARAFYEPIASKAELRVAAALPNRVRFAGTGPSFSIVAGPPSENVRLAFGADEDARVRDPDGNVVELVSQT